MSCQNKVFWKIFLPAEKLLILQLYIIALGIESAPFILWSSLASRHPKVRWYKSIFCSTFGQLFVIGSSSLYLVKLFFRHHFVIHNHLLWQTMAGQDGQNPKQFTLCIFRPSRVDSSASENFFHTPKTYDFYKLYLFTFSHKLMWVEWKLWGFCGSARGNILVLRQRYLLRSLQGI